MNASAILMQLVFVAPSLLIAVGAIVFALVRMRRHPKTSVLTIAAFLFGIAGNILALISQGWIMSQAQAGADPEQVATAAAVMGGIQIILNACFLILIVIAVFIERAPKPVSPHESAVAR